MKYFINTKTGYTAGVYGNTGEQYLLIMIDGGRYNSFFYDGQFGHEHRVAKLLKQAAFDQIHTNEHYGKLTRKEVNRWMKSEKEAIEEVTRFIEGEY